MKSKKSRTKERKRLLNRAGRFIMLRESAFQSAMTRHHKRVNERKLQIANELENNDVCKDLGLPGDLPFETRLILGHTMALDQLGAQLPSRKTFQKA